jgi:hypothetical protein
MIVHMKNIYKFYYIFSVTKIFTKVFSKIKIGHFKNVQNRFPKKSFEKECIKTRFTS